MFNATPQPLYPREREEAGLAPGPVWMVAENLTPPPGFDPRTFLPVTSRYTDYDIPTQQENGVN